MQCYIIQLVSHSGNSYDIWAFWPFLCHRIAFSDITWADDKTALAENLTDVEFFQSDTASKKCLAKSTAAVVDCDNSDTDDSDCNDKAVSSELLLFTIWLL